jgi:hypothetical protein
MNKVTFTNVNNNMADALIYKEGCTVAQVPKFSNCSNNSCS